MVSLQVEPSGLADGVDEGGREREASTWTARFGIERAEGGDPGSIWKSEPPAEMGGLQVEREAGSCLLPLTTGKLTARTGCKLSHKAEKSDYLRQPQ